ncbi:TetR/AcrR family transcriptional regulator [Actinomadura alba]|uniref:TetR/AcrR family transcriptional regulator n=1 Tax=Actinomadura alba TaxID=406431 RepID=A0ABR7LUT5_9ACTN|nr:TetR/AcrR family transcriptional regulator [Actinomadura alba]MBC6468438.1 TetR/AcrR family transcriptional regulator [Actinomadura alba]
MADTRNRLLDAATEVLLRDGAQALTLEAVASQARVSKGGLFYHFPTKQALVAGMVDRLVTQFDTALTQAGDEPGAATRVYLAATVEEQPTAAGLAADRTTAALFAAALVEPEALTPLREVYREWQRRLEDDGIDPALATAVRLAADGWWLARLIDLAPPAPGLHERVYVVLSDLIERN